jgi:hypothetical protein
MKFARSIFGGSCPEPPRTRKAARSIVDKICQHYERLRTGGKRLERTIDGFRVEYNVLATNLNDFINRQSLTLSLQEISRDTKHSIFAKGIPVTAYIAAIGQLLEEAIKLNIYETNNRHQHEPITQTQRDVIATLLCQIGWHGSCFFCIEIVPIISAVRVDKDNIRW